MASWMVHLRVADELLKKIENLDEKAFVMGNIAPDSGVPNEDWTVFQPPKDVSHFCSPTLNGPTIFTSRFYRLIKKKLPKINTSLFGLQKATGMI